MERTVSYSRKKLVTILISDIHDFTGLVDSLGDQCVSELLQAWSSRVSAIIRTYDGMVDKFLGDAVMAVGILAVTWSEMSVRRLPQPLPSNVSPTNWA